MNWNTEAKLRYLIRLPWTILAETTEDGEKVLKVAEVPSAMGSGPTDEASIADLWDSLQSSLEAYLHFGDPVPTPEEQALPWERAHTIHDSPPRLYLSRSIESLETTTALGRWEHIPA